MQTTHGQDKEWEMSSDHPRSDKDVCAKTSRHFASALQGQTMPCQSSHAMLLTSLPFPSPLIPLPAPPAPLAFLGMKAGKQSAAGPGR